MQIAKQKCFTERLFNYGTSLRNSNEFENCYSLGLSLSSEIGTNNVNLKREKGSKFTNLNYIKLVEIDISEEINNIKRNKPVIINGKKNKK
jgi:hypothetical protein